MPHTRYTLLALLTVASRRCGASVPCDPNATSEARDLLQMLHDLQTSGRTLSGQLESDEHDDAAGGSKTFTARDWRRVFNITGRHPALWGSQFLWGSPDWAAPYRQQMVDQAVALWESPAGRVVTALNFHLCPPTEAFLSRRCHWSDIEGDDMGKRRPDLVPAVLREGTVENRIWLADLDMMASFLKQLAQKNVPVLWRPFHEANGAWFWWGGQPPHLHTALWAQMHARFSTVHGLHNLIWVYGASSQFDVAPYYPGEALVDVCGQDLYAISQNRSGFTDALYADVVRVSAGKKVIAWTEIGLAPGRAVLASQPHAFLMTWGGFEVLGNDTKKNRKKDSPDELRALYDNSQVLKQGDLRPWALRRDAKGQGPK